MTHPEEPGSPESAQVDFERDEDVSGAIRQAVRDALAGHALRGNLVVVWKDGRPMLVPAPILGEEH